MPAGTGAERGDDPLALAAPARHDRVPRRAAGRALLDRRGRTSASSGFGARRQVRRDGGADRADGRSPATSGGGSAARCSSGAGRATRRPSSAASSSPRVRPRTSRSTRTSASCRSPGTGTCACARSATWSGARTRWTSASPGTHVLAPPRAVAEWQRLEPLRDRARAAGAARVLRARPHLPRDRRRRDGQATGLCWVSSHGEIGPAVGAEPEDLVPVVLAALDRVAKTQEPDELSLFCTTIAWWLLRRLRGLGLPGLLAELGDVLDPAAGARPLRADAAAPSTLTA